MTHDIARIVENFETLCRVRSFGLWDTRDTDCGYLAAYEGYIVAAYDTEFKYWVVLAPVRTHGVLADEQRVLFAQYMCATGRTHSIISDPTKFWAFTHSGFVGMAAQKVLGKWS